MWSPQETQEFGDLISALKNYRAVCHSHLGKLEATGLRTPEDMAAIREAVNCNADLLEYVAYKAPKAFNQQTKFEFPTTRSETQFDSTDLHQITSALKSACRDWTAIGDLERHQTYNIVVEAVKEYLPENAVVCVPGAGLCRLAVEIASSGFRTIANENSLIMVIFARIAMKRKRMFRVFPFCHQLSGLDNFRDALLSAQFPEAVIRERENGEGIVDPVTLLEQERLMLMAGGFELLKDHLANECDAVVTCYFIDVVKNIQDTIEAIYQLLKPSGYWINIGPMLLHDSEDEFFTSAALDDLTLMAQRARFQIIKEDRVETSYIVNPKAHIRTLYRCKFFVARK